ncbi:MAG TPA: sulfite exporter TauE/SafE family protein, partial [Thauera sp.]|nr:sulfite exporter TauE/SafE family protein [Thauera sp.]
MDALGWFVTAIAILLTGISKAGLGGALGGLAVPFMSMWIPPRDAVAVVLPILIVMDMVGIRVWRGKADRGDLRHLIPAALLGIGAGTLLFGVLSDRMVKLVLGLIALAFVADRLLRRRAEAAAPGERSRAPAFAWLCGAGAGFTSTLAHAGGPPIMAYLLSRGLPKERFVATSVFFFTAINLAKLP